MRARCDAFTLQYTCCSTTDASHLPFITTHQVIITHHTASQVVDPLDSGLDEGMTAASEPFDDATLDDGLSSMS